MDVKKKTPKRRYITGFDGLRTIGVLGVILYHLRPEIFKGGYLGVPIFMVVSGYLITDGLVMEFNRTGRFDYKRFWMKRIRRLYPALLVVLFGTAAYITLFARALLHNLHAIVVTNLLYVYNWWQIGNGQSYFARFAAGESPFTHLWTLSIEGQFYLIFPLLVMLLLGGLHLSRAKVGGVTLSLAGLSAIWMAVLYWLSAKGPNFDPSRLYYGTDTRVFSILLGAALAFVWPSAHLARHVTDNARRTLDGTGVVALLSMLLMVIFVGDQSVFLYEGGMLLFSIFVTILVAVVAHPASHLNRWLSNPLFSWVGSRSYGIYLYQFPVMIFFEQRFTHVADHPWAYPIAEVIIILVLTELSYRLVEQPAAHWLFRRQLSGQAPVASQSQRPVRDRLEAWWRSLKPVQMAVVVVLTVTFAVGMTGVVQAPSAKVQRTALQKHLHESARAKAADKRRYAAYKSSLHAQSKGGTKHRRPLGKNAFARYGLTDAEFKFAAKVSLTGVGDSVMADGKPLLEKIFPESFIDAAVSRQATDGIQILKQYQQSGTLARNVLVGLGTNGPVTNGEIADLMRTVGRKRHVFWVNTHVPTRQWQNQVNRTLAQAARHYRNLTVIDWYGYANGHPEWFYNDNVHPNQQGNPRYAAFVAKQIVDTLRQQ
ncbi:acyltransferase family protein [Lacticaseibacillus thailandensis]|uniref:Acyltransferase n=1 Tax=Lacticaseibacillus thailandensis DSM 22698 = JCM 13996 TaxID=1423810 RepID=A0A0R2CHY6_9LACO|nr:acyltransferase family protein [Lacticaseibacillus thailandensis]KRM88027.1 acyltransferase [Lacticaseibacillus thailandensis DSM 22698 = JCM 13996]